MLNSKSVINKWAVIIMAIVASILGLQFAFAQDTNPNSTSDAAVAQEADTQDSGVDPFAPRLQQIRNRGFVKCGTVDPRDGFAYRNNAGDWDGLDIDFCKALSAAILGDESKYEMDVFEGTSRFVKLESGELDILVRNGAWTISRDTKYGVNFVGATFYDAQAFMLRRAEEKISALELDGQTICVLSGTEYLFNLDEFFFQNQTAYKPVVYETVADIHEAYRLGLCDVVTAQQTDLASIRAQLDVPEDHVILPEFFALESYGPAVRSGDDEWRDTVFWVLQSLIMSEELGLTSQSVLSMEQSPIFAARQFLGLEGPFPGDEVGLPRDWTFQVISRVGNYGEIFERHFGQDSALKMRRGQNAVWTSGGLHNAMPF